MKKVFSVQSLIATSLLALWVIVPPAMANADQKLRYSCSAQVYEAAFAALKLAKGE